METIELICKFCLENEPDDSKLIVPCICSGSVKYVHRNCLDKWIIKKVERDISIDKFYCELCNFEYEYHISRSIGNISNINKIKILYNFLYMIFVFYFSTFFLGFLLNISVNNIENDTDKIFDKNNAKYIIIGILSGHILYSIPFFVYNYHNQILINNEDNIIIKIIKIIICIPFSFYIYAINITNKEIDILREKRIIVDRKLLI